MLQKPPHLKGIICFFLLVWSVPFWSHASEDKLSINEISLQQSTEKSNRQFTGEIRYETMLYVTPLPEAPQLSRSQYLSAGAYLSDSFGSEQQYSYALDVQAGTFFIRSQSNYLVKELYGEKRLNDSERVYVGRKRFIWSEADAYWLLGLWQPNYAIDLLRPEEEGLFGVFYEHDYDKFSLVAYGSPLFIPTVGPDLREENGSLVSDSRWYRRPSEQYNFNNRINSISYKLNIPEAMELATQPSLGVTGKWGEPQRGFWVRSSLGLKPMNDLILGRQNFKVIDQDKVDVKVTPSVAMHNIFSVDTGFETDSVKTSLSYIEDNPLKKVPPTDWSYQHPQAMRAYSVLFQFDLQKWTRKSVQVDLGYLKIFGGNVVDITSDESPDSFTLFDERFKFKDAVSLRARSALFQAYQKPFMTQISYLYDYSQRGSLLGTEFQFFPVKNWAVLFGLDAMGVETEDSSSHFLNQYRANDRYYGGITYVF